MKPRRSNALPMVVAFAVVLVQAVTLVVASPISAGAAMRPVAGCPLSAEALVTLAATRAPTPSCAWPEIAQAADTSVIHRACTIVGTEADEVLTGTGGKDVICGYQGDDVIKALTIPHDRDDFRRKLGQLRNGFGREDLSLLLTQQSFDNVSVRPLAPQAGAKGPALLLATATASVSFSTKSERKPRR